MLAYEIWCIEQGKEKEIEINLVMEEAELSDKEMEPEEREKEKLDLYERRQALITLQNIHKKYGKGQFGFSFLDSDSYRLYQCRNEVTHLAAIGKYEEAQFELQRLEAGLDLNRIRNISGILNRRCGIDRIFCNHAQANYCKCKTVQQYHKKKTFKGKYIE